MPRGKRVNQDASYSADTAVADESLEDNDLDRLHDGLMLMPAGGALRMRPSGHGPDSDEHTSYYD